MIKTEMKNLLKDLEVWEKQIDLIRKGLNSLKKDVKWIIDEKDSNTIAREDKEK